MAATTKGRAKAQAVTPAEIEAIATFLKDHIALERDRQIDVLVRTLLAGVNANLEGPSGVAKSLLLDELSACIVDCIFFSKPLHPSMPPDAVIGNYDYAKMAQGGAMERNVEGKLPAANVAFIDEITRSGAMMQDALLPPLNASKRQAELNGGMDLLPNLKAVFSAANQGFNMDDPYEQAFGERISMIQEVGDLKSDESFKELVKRSHSRYIEDDAGTFEAKRPTITLDQLTQAQHEVRLVDPTEVGFLTAFAELRSRTATKMYVSVRRWLELMRVFQANAWMAGRAKCIKEDLVIAEDGIGRDKDQRATARKLVNPYRSHFERRAEEHRGEAAEHFAELEKYRPELEALEPGEYGDHDTNAKATKALRNLALVRGRVEESIEEAENEQRPADGLHEFHAELLSLCDWADEHGLPSHRKTPRT